MKYVPKSLLLAQVDNINAILQTTPANKLSLQQAYGGFQLQQVAFAGDEYSVRGVRSISPGFVSKREMNNYLNALMVGIELRANQTQPI
jgi:hypothetical protein